MSLAASEWALQLPIIGGWKHVLIALAWHADEAGECHPGLERIALFAGLNEERSVRRCLRQLESIEAIKVVPSRGGRRASDYVLNVGMALPPGTPRSGPKMQQLRVNGHDAYAPPNTRSQSPGINPVPRTPLEAIPGPRVLPEHPQCSQYPVPESSLDVSKKQIPGPRVRNTRSQGPPNLHRKVERKKRKKEVAPASRRADADAAFDLFWEKYPRKRGKDDARKAFDVRLKAGVPAEDIIAGLVRHRFTASADFIPYPATWLRRGQWKDEQERGTWDWLDSLNTAPRTDDWDGTTIDGEPIRATRPH